MWPFKKEEQVTDPWEHLEIEREKILAECTMKEPCPGADVCQRCTYLNSTDKCPRHKDAPPLSYYIQRERKEYESQL